jgi:hypothetical protein
MIITSELVREKIRTANYYDQEHDNAFASCLAAAPVDLVFSTMLTKLSLAYL